jgi:hypothetical protein
MLLAVEVMQRCSCLAASRCCGFGTRLSIGLNAFLVNPRLLKTTPRLHLSRARVPGLVKYSEGSAAVRPQRKPRS